MKRGYFVHNVDGCDGCGKTDDLSELNGNALCGNCHDEASK